MLGVLLMSTEDKASRNIRDNLLELGSFEEIGTFNGHPVHLGNDLLLFEKEGLHLFFNNIDKEIRSWIDEELHHSYIPKVEGLHPIDLMVFLSKHSSEMEVKSLTVHPIGNYLKAEHGGEPGFLPPSAPIEMTAALKALYREKKALGIKDQTTYEVTHHGPVISSPCFFIEIGSTPSRWDLPIQGEAIARSLISGDLLKPKRDLPVAIGVGGGHYAPRFTDRAMRNKFAFGHMIPDYILSGEKDLLDLVQKAKDSTPGAEYVFVHRSNKNEKLIEGIDEAAEKLGLKVAGI